ncbi:MAG: class I adenylate-forming enzyme family protein [Acidimicrobiales bacterium]
MQQLLTAPGALFEIVEEDVRGVPMPVYKNRPRSLRSFCEAGLVRGNSATHIVSAERRIGFRDAVTAANSVSAGLAAAGVGSGDRVAILAPNSPEWIFAFWGTVNLGAVVVALNGWWKADEIAYGLADSGAKVLIADRERLERVGVRLGELGDLEAVFVLDDGGGGRESGAAAAVSVSAGGHAPELAPPERAITRSGGASLAGAGGAIRWKPFAALVESPSEAFPSASIAEDDPAVIMYTSGTTGRPKGAVSTHRMMIANLQNTYYLTVASKMIWGSDDLAGGQPVALITAPMFHVTGCHAGLVLAMAAGAKVVLTVGRFDPEQALRLIEEERVTVVTTVPTMVARMVEHPTRHAYDLSSVRTVAYGGSPSGEVLRRRVRETFPKAGMVRNAYGLTESASAVTVNSGPELAAKPTSVGRAVPGVEIRIMGIPDGDALGGGGRDGAGGGARSGAGGVVPLPPGETGEIWVRGAQIMPGYWGSPEATAAAITDGWLHTGDIGYLDEEGYLYVTDRAKDMIIRGGENVYCVEIEDRLIQHPGVRDVAVIGVPHPVLGEEVKAIVQVEAGSSLTGDELRAWVGETLANFKIPAYVELRTEPLPRNPTGKLLKNLLRGAGGSSFAETL